LKNLNQKNLRKNSDFLADLPKGKIQKLLEISLSKIFRFYGIIFPGGKQKFHIFCPFHAESQPSFYVTLDNNFAFCFGCNKAFDPLAFVQAKEKCSRVSAFETLAHIGGVELTQEDIGQLYSIFNKISLEQTEQKQSRILDKLALKIEDDFIRLYEPFKCLRILARYFDSAWEEFDQIYLLDGSCLMTPKKLDYFKDWFYRWRSILQKAILWTNDYDLFVRESYAEVTDENLGTEMG
jgi:hypothetical protein